MQRQSLLAARSKECYNTHDFLGFFLGLGAPFNKWDALDGLKQQAIASVLSLARPLIPYSPAQEVCTCVRVLGSEALFQRCICLAIQDTMEIFEDSTSRLAM